MGITRDQGKLKIDGGNNERKTIRTRVLPPGNFDAHWSAYVDLEATFSGSQGKKTKNKFCELIKPCETHGLLGRERPRETRERNKSR